MKHRIFILLFTAGFIAAFSACDKKIADTEALSATLMKPTTTAVSPTPSQQESLNAMTKQFLKDTKMPDDIYGQFMVAIQGDKAAQKWVEDNYKQDKYFSFIDAVFPYRDGDAAYMENECYYNIGELYYNGNKAVPIKKNKEKAFYWLNLSAESGSNSGAILAGDMSRFGEGIPVNEKAAFLLYQKALGNEINGTAYERIANCYEEGIGTNTEKQKALEYYFKSALYGNEYGLYKLSDSKIVSPKQSLLFLKAASTMDYSADYFTMAYGGIEGYSTDELKLKLTKRLTRAWNNGTDAVALQLQKGIHKNKYFSKNFVKELVKTSYSYSYHSFAEKYGIKHNRSYKDGKNIKFALSRDNKSDNEFANENVFEAKEYLKYKDCEFYELDFDGDGKNEIGIPLLSGAGGAFMYDGFGVYKKNKAGKYKEYAGGPDCTLRDAMRLIKYKGRIYFITNPFSDTKNKPHNITAYTIDTTGKGHKIYINCNKYKPKEIMKQVYSNYNTATFKSFRSEIMTQAYKAISATKRHKMYNPNTAVKLRTKKQESFYASPPVDVYFKTDINNDKVKEFIRKGHIITQDKYYNDYNLFQMYTDESKLLKHTKPILDLLPQDDYYGLHSGGNIYKLLPVGGNIVQFWTREKDDKTYCCVLTRNELLYGLHIFIIQDNKAVPVFDSLLFDEVQDIHVKFE